MCRILGCVSAEPISIEHELLHAENPLIQQSEDHDSGWGMAVYRQADSEQPELVRFPEAAYATASSSARRRCAGASSTPTCGARRSAG